MKLSDLLRRNETVEVLRTVSENAKAEVYKAETAFEELAKEIIKRFPVSWQQRRRVVRLDASRALLVEKPENTYGGIYDPPAKVMVFNVEEMGDA